MQCRLMYHLRRDDVRHTVLHITGVPWLISFSHSTVLVGRKGRGIVLPGINVGIGVIGTSEDMMDITNALLRSLRHYTWLDQVLATCVASAAKSMIHLPSCLKKKKIWSELFMPARFDGNHTTLPHVGHAPNLYWSVAGRKSTLSFQTYSLMPPLECFLWYHMLAIPYWT